MIGKGRRTLARRLRVLAQWIPTGSRVADIGTDHGMLPVFLAKRSAVASVIVTETSCERLAGAVQHSRDHGVEDSIEFRSGDGLSPLGPAEVDVIVIAGIGDRGTAGILTRGRHRLSGVRRLLLAPLGDGALVRRWLLDHAWDLRQEVLVEQRGQVYPCLMAEPGEGLRAYRVTGVPSACGVLAGPWIIRSGSDLGHQRWTREEGRLTAIVQGIGRDASPAVHQRLRLVRQILVCYRTCKGSASLVATMQRNLGQSDSSRSASTLK